MHLSTVRIDGVRGIRRLELPLGRGAPLVVTGPAASGKTSVLEAILHAIHAFRPGGLVPDPAPWIGAGGDGAAVELVWTLDEEERAYAKLDTPSVHARWAPRGATTLLPLRVRELIARRSVAYFDAARTLDGQSRSPSSGPRLDRERARNKFDWVERRLLDLATDEAGQLVAHLEERGVVLASRDLGATRRFDTWLAALCPRLRWGGVIGSGDKARATFARPDGQRLTMDALSASEQMAVLFAASLDALPQDLGLLLMDTPELAVHPAEHAGFFQTLCQLRPEVQVIAGSASAGILRGMERDRVVVLGG